jgi:hypothetical protein
MHFARISIGDLIHLKTWLVASANAFISGYQARALAHLPAYFYSELGRSCRRSSVPAAIGNELAGFSAFKREGRTTAR